jgi:hypothetical protein
MLTCHAVVLQSHKANLRDWFQIKRAHDNSSLPERAKQGVFCCMGQRHTPHFLNEVTFQEDQCILIEFVA